MYVQRVRHDDYVLSITFSPKGNLLASGSLRGIIKLWDIKTGQLLWDVVGHNGAVWGLAFNSDGTLLISGSADTILKVWRVDDGALVKTLVIGDPIRSLAISSDGQLCAIGTGNFLIKLWNLASNSISLIGKEMSSICSLVFSPDQRLLASGSSDGIKIWQISDSQLVRMIPTKGVYSLSFSNDNQLLASGSNDHIIRLWKVKDGTLLKTLSGHVNTVCSVVFHPVEPLLVSGGWDGKVKLWRLLDKQTVQEIKEITLGNQIKINTITLSPDGQFLAIAYDQIGGQPGWIQILQIQINLKNY